MIEEEEKKRRREEKEFHSNLRERNG